MTVINRVQHKNQHKNAEAVLLPSKGHGEAWLSGSHINRWLWSESFRHGSCASGTCHWSAFEQTRTARRWTYWKHQPVKRDKVELEETLQKQRRRLKDMGKLRRKVDVPNLDEYLPERDACSCLYKVLAHRWSSKYHRECATNPNSDQCQFAGNICGPACAYAPLEWDTSMSLR